MKNKKLTRYLAAQSMVFTTLIVVLFVSGILFFYAKLSSETQEHITKIGELNAATSSEQIDKYFSSGVDTLKIAGYTLDSMIRSGSSEKEILDYLQNQSMIISNITSGNCSTGYYGYINGKYLDGTGWIPEEGYTPSERPWYIEAQSRIGRVTFVGPYVDSETHKTIITLSKTLCDVKSVVAMDYSMDRLQAIAEEVTSQGESYAEIVLDREYQVIAHSDSSEIGKCYFTEQNTFGKALVEKLRNTDEDFFYMNYGGSDYVVYSTEVANDWFCLSVIDETAALREQRKPLIFMIAAALSIFLTHIIIMMITNRNTRIMQQLSEHLSQAENTISEKNSKIGEISRIAFRDALTGVGSKSAFNNLAAEIAEKRRTEKTPVAVVMMDVNNLKHINDTYGHKAGDKYLRGCCRLICDIFDHSPVFRIGGDEFTAILQNSDHEKCAELVQQLIDACEESCSDEDKEPWERYSIAVGISVCAPGETTLDQALARADKAMYEEKRSFKKKHSKIT